MTKEALIKYVKSEKNDELYTPTYAITPLLQYIYIYSGVRIWECTDYGGSNITKVLRQYGAEVITTHKDNFDFLHDTPNFEFDMIITNPPYTLKDEFLEKCYSYGKPFALLLPITSLEGVKRGELFRKNGIELIVLDKRVNFINNDKKNNWFNTSWFCWKLLDKPLNFAKLNTEPMIQLF